MYSSNCTISRVADTKMQFVFKYLFCIVYLTHIFHINVHKFNNKYVSSCELCNMRGMIELKGNVIGKHTNAHTLLEVQCFNTSAACFGPPWPIIRECKVAYNNLTYLSFAVQKNSQDHQCMIYNDWICEQ
jgi:hypothetical protein